MGGRAAEGHMASSKRGSPERSPCLFAPSPIFPSSCATNAPVEACFALVFVCADMPHPGISVGRQPSRSDDLNLAQPSSVCNTFHIKRLGSITWLSSLSQRVYFAARFTDMVFVAIREL